MNFWREWRPSHDIAKAPLHGANRGHSQKTRVHTRYIVRYTCLYRPMDLPQSEGLPDGASAVMRSESLVVTQFYERSTTWTFLIRRRHTTGETHEHPGELVLLGAEVLARQFSTTLTRSILLIFLYAVQTTGARRETKCRRLIFHISGARKKPSTEPMRWDSNAADIFNAHTNRIA